jgi:uncharacterized protein YjbI with pentapeptide repeats
MGQGAVTRTRVGARDSARTVGRAVDSPTAPVEMGHPAKRGPLKQLWIFLARPDPPWWIPHGFAALIIAIAVIFAIQIVDNRRADRESEQQAAAQNYAQVLENLRFVREYAASRGALPQALESVGSAIESGQCPPPLDPNSERPRLQPFESLNLAGQNLALLRLPHSNFARANLDGGRLAGTVLAPDSDLAGATLVEAMVVDGDLSGVNLVNADLTNADLFGAKLCNANLAGAKLKGANLTNALLTDVDFGDANGTWLPAAWAPDLGFTVHGKVNLSDADLAGADLSGARNLADAMLYNIYYNESTKWPPGFQPKDPSRANRCLRADGYSSPTNPCLMGEG